MLVAQISDTHILSPESDQPAASLRADCLRQTVADINAQRPDVVVMTGDTVQHGRPDEYARLRALLAPLQAPLYMVPGNRDDKNAMRAAFPEHAYMREGRWLPALRHRGFRCAPHRHRHDVDRRAQGTLL